LSSNRAISTPWGAAFIISSLFKRNNFYHLTIITTRKGAEEVLVDRYQKCEQSVINDNVTGSAIEGRGLVNQPAKKIKLSDSSSYAGSF
jgi:hypothetical protein